VRNHYRRDLAQRLEEKWGTAPGARPQGRSQGAWDGNRSQGRQGPPGAAGQPRAPHMQGRGGGGPRGGPPAPPRGPPRLALPARVNPTSSLRKSAMVAGETAAPPYREALLMRTLLNHPWLLEEYAEDVAALPLASSALSRLRDAMLSAQAVENSLDTETLRSH